MLNACVLGLGSIGLHHARVLADLAHVRLRAVCDRSTEARERYRAPREVEVFDDAGRMLAEVKPDLVVVAVPTELHCAMTCLVLEAGAHVLVEKPIARSLDEADRMIACAERYGRLLGVGHLERCNPAVVEIKRAVTAGELGRVFQLHARRMGPFPLRVQDVGVTLDIATHDIDVMHFITGSRVARAVAETTRQAHRSCEDMLSALLRFESGEIGMLDVHWLSPKKVRELCVVGEGGMLVADYLAQDVFFYKNGRINQGWTQASHFSGAVEGDMVKLHLPKREPLRALHEDFVASIRQGTPPAVSGADGRAALEVAHRLLTKTG